MITLTKPAARQLLEAEVQKDPSAVNPDLFYSAGCLVGRVLSAAGLDLDLLDRADDGSTVDQVDWEDYGLEMTDQTETLLTQVQDLADHGQTFQQVWDALE